MLELILIAIALIGSLVCGAIDLKTTEIPDIIPHMMAGLGVVIWLFISILENNFQPLLLSILVGGSFLILGWFFYLTKQWGGGDAKLLTAIGFLLPVWLLSSTQFPFPLVFVFNLFFVGFVYMIIYIFVLGLIRKEIRINFIKGLKRWWKPLVPALVIPWFFFQILPWFPIILNVFFLVFIYARAVEKYFNKEIPVSQIRVGDVLADGKIDGLTKEEVAKLIKKGGKVRIKDGVRYGMVFFLTLLVTLFYGSILEELVLYLI